MIYFKKKDATFSSSGKPGAQCRLKYNQMREATRTSESVVLSCTSTNEHEKILVTKTVKDLKQVNVFILVFYIIYCILYCNFKVWSFCFSE